MSPLLMYFIPTHWRLIILQQGVWEAAQVSELRVGAVLIKLHTPVKGWHGAAYSTCEAFSQNTTHFLRENLSQGHHLFFKCVFFSLSLLSYFTEQILTLSSLFPLLCRGQPDLCMGKWHQRTVSGFLNDEHNLPAQIPQLFFVAFLHFLWGFLWPRFWQSSGRQMEPFLNPRSSFWWRARRNESATLDDGRNRLSIMFGLTNQISWA